MIIDLNTWEEQVIPNFRGGEKEITVRMFQDDFNKIAHGILKWGFIHMKRTARSFIYCKVRAQYFTMVHMNLYPQAFAITVRKDTNTV